MTSSLDNLDQRLIQELETDIRMPYTVLSSRLGVSMGTVRRRLQRLVEDKVVSLEVVPHPHKLGYHITAFMGFRVRLGQSAQVSAGLASNPAFTYLSTTLGFYDLVGYAAFRSPEDIADFVGTKVSKIKGIEWSETLVIVRYCKHALYGVFAGDPPVGEFDALDRKIVHALYEDVRDSYESLSVKLGVDVGTVRSRVKRMLRERSIIFAPSIDPSKIGYEVVVTIGIRANATSLVEVQRQLETNEQVRGLSMVTGRFDFVMTAYFQDSQHLATFIKKDLSSIRGIEHYDVFFHMDVLKSSRVPTIDLI
jgi:Lrp/AsnC family transcriptional regulator, regulator for asnA, asnC and gidA